jgi:hypothetical protein
MATTSQVVTSQLPAAFETYYKEGVGDTKGLIPQAFELYGKGTPEAFKTQYVDPLQAAGLYGAGRVAGFSPYQTQIGTELGKMQTPSQFQMGLGAMGSAYDALGGGTFYPQVMPAATPAGGAAPAGGASTSVMPSPGVPAYPRSGLPSILDTGLIGQYMSPYAQNVIDVQKTKAIEDAQKAQLSQNLGAARQGTYGGARQMLATTEREKALAQGLGDIQARGLQSAYEAAQKGLEAERTARLQQGQLLGTLGQQFGGLGVQQQAADIDRLKTLGAYGDLQRAIEQQQIDARYQDVLKGIQYPERQLEQLSSFIRGIPMTEQTTTTTTPPPSFASQLAGLGLSGLSLYNLSNR